MAAEERQAGVKGVSLADLEYELMESQTMQWSVAVHSHRLEMQQNSVVAESVACHKPDCKPDCSSVMGGIGKASGSVHSCDSE